MAIIIPESFAPSRLPTTPATPAPTPAAQPTTVAASTTTSAAGPQPLNTDGNLGTNYNYVT